MLLSVAPDSQRRFAKKKVCRAVSPTITEKSAAEQLKLDIYGNSNEDVQRCKSEISNKLDGVLQKVTWKDKPHYKEDRKYILMLSRAQVKLYS